MKTIERGHHAGDRYAFDFDTCASSKGWAQIDTRQDASYYGNWANPSTLQTLCFAEGDTTLVTCTDAASYAEHVRGMFGWHADRGGASVDPGCGATAAEITARFAALGLGDLAGLTQDRELAVAR